MKIYKLAFVAACIAAISSAHALSIVTNRADIGASDSIDWGQFGPAVSSISNPSVGSTNLGAAFMVSSDAVSLTRYDQATVPFTNPWFGNFAQGDHLLYASTTDAGGSPTVVLDFAQTYAAVGLQVMNNYYGAFTAQVQAYDGLGNLLGTFTENGNSNGAADNSAIFLGVKDTSSDIAEIRYSIASSQTNTGDFAFNQVSLAQCNAVPEPCSMLALAGGIGAILRRRARKA